MQGLQYLASKLDDSFAAFILNAMPLSVMIVDKEARVQVINEAAQRFFYTSRDAAYLKKCGDVIRCLHACTSRGCGGCPACAKCILRKSVFEALEGQIVSRNKGNFDVVFNDEIKRLTLLVTASPILYENNQMVIVLIEDVSLVTQLQGLIPICSACHRIRGDQEEWIALENYLIRHSEAELTHDYCPVCSEKMLAQHTLRKEEIG